jgi:hypothetical protein
VVSVNIQVREVLAEAERKFRGYRRRRLAYELLMDRSFRTRSLL